MAFLVLWHPQQYISCMANHCARIKDEGLDCSELTYCRGCSSPCRVQERGCAAIAPPCGNSCDACCGSHSRIGPAATGPTLEALRQKGRKP